MGAVYHEEGRRASPRDAAAPRRPDAGETTWRVAALGDRAKHLWIGDAFDRILAVCVSRGWVSRSISTRASRSPW
jgi:hypothetical protein